MADKQSTAVKASKQQIDKLRRELDGLRKERLEVLGQLRLGASLDVRKPTRIRRQIARALGRLRRLELDEIGFGSDDPKKSSSKEATLARKISSEKEAA